MHENRMVGNVNPRLFFNPRLLTIGEVPFKWQIITVWEEPP